MPCLPSLQLRLSSPLSSLGLSFPTYNLSESDRDVSRCPPSSTNPLILTSDLHRGPTSLLK